MLLLVDLDGVVYRGTTPVPGVNEVLGRRTDGGDTVIFVTNNSRWHREEYRARLQGMGLSVGSDRIVTAARATALLLAGDPPTGPTMVLGGAGLARELREARLPVVSPTDHGLARDPAALVVGVDFGLSYRRLTIAAEAVRRGARFVATNRDPIYPAADALWAGAGAMVAAVATAAGRGPDVVVGKPEPRLFREAAESVGVAPADAVVVGDSLVTDIAAAHAIGARSVLMMTGVTDEAAARAVEPERRPTHIARDAAELERVLEDLAAGT